MRLRGFILVIAYKNKKIEKVCTNAESAKKQYGIDMAGKIQQRINEITAADSVESMIQYHIGRCHALSQNRKGQYAVDLVNAYRLIFTVTEDVIQIATITEIVDYH